MMIPFNLDSAKRLMLICFIGINLFFFSSASSALARKTGYKLKVEKNSARDEEDVVKGSFMVASQCPDCNNGYKLSQVVFSGFDKPRNSSVETFFITNNTDRTITGINLYIEYRTLDGQQLHKRFYPLRCNIPAGETRQASLQSWDKNKSFVYIKSRDSERNPGTPFDIIFDPVAFYLRF